jgi:hypothetical protein
MNDEEAATITRRLVRHFVIFLVVMFALLVVMLAIATTAFFGWDEVWSALFAGWLRYPARVLPEVTVNGSMIATGLGSAALAGWGLHGICRWIARHRGRTWRPKWTLCLMAGMALLFAAAISMTALLHQSMGLRREGLFDRVAGEPRFVEQD